MNSKMVLGAIGAMVVATGVTLAFQFSAAPSQNVICARLEGRWLVDAEITGKLDPAPESKLPRAVDFVADPAVFKKIAAVYPRFAATEPLTSGTATLNGEKHFYILVNQSGDSHLVMFTATREAPVGEPHSIHVAMGCSRNQEKDMLFLGGDLARESAACYTRVPK